MVDSPLQASSAWLGRPRPRLKRVGTRYTRFVGLMKLLLPVIAGALVAMVIVWPQFADLPRGLSLGIAALSVDTVGGQRLVNARYTGTDARDQPFTVTADKVDQSAGESETVDLTNPKADLALASGNWLAVRAPTGRYNRTSQELNLLGAVDVFHDEGYEIHTRDATMLLGQGQAFGASPVVGRGPTGRINSQGFRILGGGSRILFTGAARLQVQPSRRQGAQ